MPQCSNNYEYKITTDDAGRTIGYILERRLSLYTGTITYLKYFDGIKLRNDTEGTLKHFTGEGAIFEESKDARNSNAGRKYFTLKPGEIVQSPHVDETVYAGETLILNFNCKPETADLTPEDIPLEILYEDDSLLIVNKPAEMVVHPTCLHQTGTLANAVLYHWNQIGAEAGIHFVSRLDNGTSGLVTIARNGFVQERMRDLAISGKLRKIYHGVCDISGEQEQININGPLNGESQFGKARNNGTIDRPIARKAGSIMEREVSSAGKRAVTLYNVISVNERAKTALVSFELRTGRTHQIRVHSKSMGAPLVGDSLYGKSHPLISHQALHARELWFEHPITGEQVHVVAPYPADFTGLLD